VHTITPLSSLPVISDAVTIDGYTQPGASANTLAVGNNAVLLIEIDGSSSPLMGGGFLLAGLTTVASGGNSIIRGLVINRFADPRFVGIPGIALFGDGNVIEGNFIGTDPTGTLDRGNGTHGIIIAGSNNRIGGTLPQARNLISGNGTTGLGNPGNGIVIGGSGDQIGPPVHTLVLGNYIGTNAAGSAALPNSDTGIDSFGSNLIGNNSGAAASFPAGNPNANNDIVGTNASPIDPELDPDGLRNNGGPTQTIALLSTSPALDKGTSNGLTGALSTDQRGAGFPRTVDQPAIPNGPGSDGTDIGAFELDNLFALITNITRSGVRVDVFFHGTSGRRFGLERRTSLTSGDWQRVIGADVTASGPTSLLTDPNSPDPGPAFYRVRSLTPSE